HRRQDVVEPARALADAVVATERRRADHELTIGRDGHHVIAVRRVGGEDRERTIVLDDVKAERQPALGQLRLQRVVQIDEGEALRLRRRRGVAALWLQRAGELELVERRVAEERDRRRAAVRLQRLTIAVAELEPDPAAQRARAALDRAEE